MVLVAQLEPLPAAERRRARAGCPRARRGCGRGRSAPASPCPAGSACRAARREPTASGCPGRTSSVMPSSASTFARAVSTKNPRASPCTSGSRRIGPSRFVSRRRIARRLVERSLDAVGDQPRERERRGGRRRRRVPHVERALGLRDDEVVHEPAVAGQRLGAHARRTTARSRRARARARSRRPRARSGALLTAWRSSRDAVRHQRRAIRHVPGQASERPSRVRREQRARAERHVAVDVPAQVHARGTAAPGPAPGRSARAPARAFSGRQLQVGAAERHDARVRVGAGRHGQLVGRVPGAEHGEARARLAARLQRDRARRRSAELESRTGPPPASSAANARATSAKSTTPVSGECSAATPRAVRLDLAQSVGVHAPQARAPRSRARGARARRAAGSSLSSRATISLPRFSNGDAVLARSRRTGRARPPRTAAP